MSFHPLMVYDSQHFHKSERARLDEGGPFTFTPERRAKLDDMLTKYPPDQKRSAVLAALYLVQEQVGYLTAPGQPPPPLPQGHVHAGPGFPALSRDRPGILAGPLTGAAVVGVGPGQDLLLGQRPRLPTVVGPAVFGQQSGQGRPTGQPTGPLLRAVATAFHVSPSVPAIGPEVRRASSPCVLMLLCPGHDLVPW